MRISDWSSDVCSSDLVGTLDASIAARIGLPAGAALVVGGADHVLSAFAAGLASEGDWLVTLGGAGDILAVSSIPLVDERFHRSERRRLGPECCRSSKSRWSPEPSKKKSLLKTI